MNTHVLPRTETEALWDNPFHVLFSSSPTYQVIDVSLA